ncbi:MAG: hypothetical protein COA95_10145 [Methylophaga sp.]|nr:MAG: hypothetical protein COA95_10145 [Methylophaga sp.]
MFNKLKLQKNEIIEVISGYKSVFITIGFFSAIINVMLLIPALYMLQVYDRVLASQNQTTLLMLTLMIVVAYFVNH